MSTKLKVHTKLLNLCGIIKSPNLISRKMGFVECDPYWNKRRCSAYGRNGFTSVMGSIWCVENTSNFYALFYHSFPSHLLILLHFFIGMKSLVNWPSNENHKLPEYQGSEKDVFKVICDYFTNASSPLSTFSLYNILVEAFIRSEAADLKFRKSKEPTEDDEEDGFSLGSRDSVRSLVIQMASPMPHKSSTPYGSYYEEKNSSRFAFF